MTEILESFIGPLPHWYHNRFLKHLEASRFVELKQPFPGVTKPIRPFSRVAVLFVPNELLRPQPSLFAQRKNQLNNIRVAFTIFRFFLDVEHERPIRFDDS